MDAHGTSRRPESAVKTPSPVLVGRTEELRTIRLAVSRPPSVVFVEGEAGIGKSRLINELATTPDRPTVPFVTANCQPLSEPFPYGPVLEALRAAGPRLSDDRPLNPVIGALRPQLPELSDRLPPALPPLPDPAAERHRLFRAVRELLGRFPNLTMVIEDVQWADVGTRELLRFIVTDPPDGLATVITYRPDELPEGTAPLGRAFHPPPATTNAHLTLHPLDVDGVRRLAEATLEGRPVSRGYAETVHRLTAGIPFVVEEAVNAWRDRHHATVPEEPIRGSHWDDLEVPAVLRHAVLDRLTGLDPVAVAVVEAAAVLAVPADCELVATVTDVDTDRARGAVAELLSIGMLVERGHGRYGLRHTLAQRAMYDALLGPRREHLHLRAAGALRDHSPPPLVQLARHYQHAGRLPEWLRYTERAADQAAAGGSVSTAVMLIDAVLADPRVPPGDLDRLARKFYRLALTSLHQDEATATLRRLIGDTRLSTETRGEVRLGLGLLQVRRSEGLTASRALLERAVAVLGSRPDLAHRGMAVLALPFLGTAPAEQTRRWLRQVEAAVDRHPPGQVRTSLLANTLSSRVYLGDPDARRRMNLLPPTATDAEEQRQLARAHVNLADAHSWVGDHADARRHLDSALTVIDECGAPSLLGSAMSTRLRLDWMAGDWTDLDARAAEQREMYQGVDPVTCELSLVSAWLAAARGEWAVAADHLDHTGIHAPDDAYFPVVVAAFGCATAMNLERGERERAVQYADRGVELLRRKGIWTWSAELVVPAVAVYRQTDPVAARRLLADLTDGIAGLRAPLAEAARDHCRALLADTDTDRLAEVRDRYERLGLAHHAAQATEQLLLAEPKLDVEALRDLTARYERFGATRSAARCSHLLRGTGATLVSRRGRRGYGDALSPRERDVARFVASGHTNQEIAQILFLSRRTVEQHVSRVLRKSGVTSRHQLRR